MSTKIRPEIKDILNASVVFTGVVLLKTSDEATEFRKSVDSEVLLQQGATITGQQTTIPMVPVQIFVLAKDRIEIETSSIRTMCKLDYPTQEALCRLAQVSHLAIVNTSTSDKRPNSFGFNVELVYEQFSGVSSLPYIAQRILSPTFQEKYNWNLNGAASKFSFKENDKQWNVIIEPRFNEEEGTKIFLSVNLHFNEARFPDEKEIVDSLNRTWEQASNVVIRIDENARA